MYGTTENKSAPLLGEHAIFRTHWHHNRKFRIGACLFSGLVVVLIIIALSVGLSRHPKDTIIEPIQQTLESRMSTENMLFHLNNLENIAMQNSGSRTALTGYNASVDYVVQTLRDRTNLNVTVQPFSFPYFTELYSPTLQLVAPLSLNFAFTRDFRNLRFGGSGIAQGNLIPVNGGCQETDFAQFSNGSIALISRGYLQDCLMPVKVMNSFNHGASGVIVYYDPGTTGLFSGGLSGMAPLPCFSTTNFFGNFFLELIARGQTLQVFMNASNTAMSVGTFNVIADTPNGNQSNTIVIGSHLDSVPAGPGINDNGSGSSVNLELAIQLSSLHLELKNRVRFCWWAAEEFGLIGSTYYVNSLSQQEKSKIVLNLNFDMLGSPNFYRAIYNGTQAAPVINAASSKIQLIFETYFDLQNIPHQTTSFDGRSDYGPFLAANISAGGLFTGAEVIKSEAQRIQYGGVANAPFDPCYHLSCDTVDNINQEVLLDNAKVAGYAVELLAMQENLREYLNNSTVV